LLSSGDVYQKKRFWPEGNVTPQLAKALLSDSSSLPLPPPAEHIERARPPATEGEPLVSARLGYLQRSSEQRASDEMVRLIRKLRWIGLENEAKRMGRELTTRAVPAADTVVASPLETD